MTYSHWSGAHGMPVYYAHDTPNTRLKTFLIGFLCIALVATTVSSVSRITVIKAAPNAPQHNSAVVPVAAVHQMPQEQPAEQPALPLDFNNQTFVSAINGWKGSTRGSYGVVVAKADGTVLAAEGADTPFFTASVYKLFVAYAAYQKVDDGTFRLDQPSAKGWTREKCLDEMIRNSDSPCAERIMGEIGRNNITTMLNGYGMGSTSLRNLTSTPRDISILLSRLQQGTDLSETSRQMMLDSMLGQKYRNGLVKGFKPASVHNKVGFNELEEYHDVGIVQLADGRTILVTVMTKNVGVSAISKLAKALSQAAAKH